jgi:hypothetical protein
VSSCKKEPDPEPIDDDGIVVPTTYNFTNVNYSGQTMRMSMLSEMSMLMKTANTSGVTVDATVLKNMFRNTGNPFADASLNTSGKKLINKCFYLDTTFYLSYMDSLQSASSSSVAGSNGVAGVVVSSSDNTKKYLFNERGLEITQILEKGIMGGVFYYQALGYYLTDDQIGASVDNSTVVAGEGTAMEHHWDEAFGYLGVPIDFPTNMNGIVYWGKYSNTVNPILNTNQTLMNAFLLGRHSISNGDMGTKFSQRDIIRTTWEKVCAGSVIHYYNEALANFTDDALRNHTLSEALAFLRCLKYSPVKIITNQQISDIEAMIGSNFYNVTINGINNAKDALSNIYNLDSVKDDL